MSYLCERCANNASGVPDSIDCWGENDGHIDNDYKGDCPGYSDIEDVVHELEDGSAKDVVQAYVARVEIIMSRSVK